MRNLITLILMAAITSSGLLDAAKVFGDEEIQLVQELDFDFSVPPFELWKGTELQPMELPELELQSQTASYSLQSNSLQESQTHSPLQFKNAAETSAQTQSHSLATSELAFADPLDFEVWNLVKWTLVVIVIAGVATYIFRFKQSPILPKRTDQKLKLLETLVIDSRTKVHLIETGSERYLVASDLNGVKSMTLVPNWNIEPEAEFALKEDSPVQTESHLAKAS